MGGGARGGRGKAEQKPIDNKKFYELIGVDSKASTDEIKKAFRKKALKEHPDKGGDPEKVFTLIFNPILPLVQRTVSSL